MSPRHAPVLLSLLAAGALLTAGCERITELAAGPATADTTRAPGVPPPGEGLVTVATGQRVPAVVQQLKSALQSSDATLVTEIDHASSSAAGDSLRAARLLLFGNPALGTPLMQSVQTAGIDLPQKMLVWQGADDSTRITYNAPAYLDARHELSGVGASLGQMRDALASLAEQAAGRLPDTAAFNADSIDAAAGLAVEVSDFGPDETFSRLRSAVQARPPLSIMASVNHAANASGDSLQQQGSRHGSGLRPDRQGGSSPGLPPTRLLVFGNPQAGTPLMQQAPTMGIDLPQKMLVWEGDEGNTFLAYNEPAYLARRHQLADTTGLGRIAQALEALAFEATSNEAEQRQLQEARQDTTGGAAF